MGPGGSTHRERAIAELAERQEGLVRRAQLLALGLGPQAISYRARTGRLHVVLPGVYAVGHGHLSRRARFLAAVWWCGEGAALSHLSAAEFYGWVEAPGDASVHVSTSRNVSRAPAGVVVHRTRRLDHHDGVTYGGLPVVDRVRTLIDLADDLDDAALRAVADALPQLPVGALAVKAARLPGRRGAGRIARLITSEDARTRSAMERRWTHYCRVHGLPQPDDRNARVAGRRADCVYAAARLVIELDSRAHHQRRAEMAADRRRDADCLVAGWRVLRLVWEDLEPTAMHAAATLRALLAA